MNVQTLERSNVLEVFGDLPSVTMAVLQKLAPACFAPDSPPVGSGMLLSNHRIDDKPRVKDYTRV